MDNKRIEELARHHGFIGDNYLISSQELQKFGESIVKECAKLCEGSIDWDAWDAKFAILTHFGVDQ